jgi:hypothetical protein
MKNYDYIPGQDKENGESPFSGKVILKIPKYLERLELVKKFQFGVNKQSEVEASDQVDSTMKAFELIGPHVVSVELEIKETSEKITDLEELGYYQEGLALMMELAGFILGGIKLGKGLKPSLNSK